MAKTAQVRARIEPTLKQDAESVFETLGVTPTEAIRVFYKQVVLRRGLPFELRVPNQVSRETLDRTDAGEDLRSFETPDELFQHLDI